jgi:hypothetical protein
MLENSVTIVLAILSLVCVYLIWENFKQSSKIRYLESSIHETIQTVQGLVNNSLCLPPPRNNYHPEPVKQSLTAQSLQQSTSSKLKDIKEEQQEENELHEDHEEQSEEEPFKMSDELKEKINNLTFNEAESDDEQIEELSFNGDDDDNDCDVECQDLPDDMTDTFNEPEDMVDTLNESKEVEMVKQESEPEQKQESEPEPTPTPVSAPEEVKKVEESQEALSDDYIKNPTLLNEMSLKELREIAEKRNLGYRGTKEQLIMKIKRDISS